MTVEWGSGERDTRRARRASRRCVSLVAGLVVAVMLAAGTASAGHDVSFRANAIAPPHGYKLQQRIVVPGLNPGGVASRAPLSAGKLYLLRVTGTFFTGLGVGPGFGDAEYIFNPHNGHVIDRCKDGTDLGVGINDTNISPGRAKTPHWGSFRRSHVYTQRFPGTGTRIRVDYHDCGYGDNRPHTQQPGTGPLTLWIYAPTG